MTSPITPPLRLALWPAPVSCPVEPHMVHPEPQPHRSPAVSCSLRVRAARLRRDSAAVVRGLLPGMSTYVVFFLMTGIRLPGW